MTRIRLVLMFYFFMVPHKAEWVTDEVYCSVVLALLQVAFLGMRDEQGQGQQGWPFSCLPYLVADCRGSDDYVLSACLD